MPGKTGKKNKDKPKRNQSDLLEAQQKKKQLRERTCAGGTEVLFEPCLC